MTHMLYSSFVGPSRMLSRLLLLLLAGCTLLHTASSQFCNPPRCRWSDTLMGTSNNVAVNYPFGKAISLAACKMVCEMELASNQSCIGIMYNHTIPVPAKPCWLIEKTGGKTTTNNKMMMVHTCNEQSDSTCNTNIGYALQTLIDTVNALGQRLENIERTIQKTTTSPTPTCPCDLTRNLALGSPAGQSSTAISYLGVNTNASVAVDGSLSNNGQAGQVSHTNQEMSPWWYVDLQATVNVSSVSITNRGDCCGDRVRNFYVTLADESPLLVTPIPGAGKVCAYHAGAVAQGVTVQLKCDTRAVGRYLIVQLNNIVEYLNLAEVQVFGCRL